MKKVGILASSQVTERNMEHVLFRLSGILAEKYHVDIMGADAYSERILNEREVYSGSTGRFVKLLPWSIGRFVRKFMTLYQYCKNESPDVILTLSGVGINGLIVAIVGRLAGVRSVNRVTSDMYKVYKYKRPYSASFKLFIKNNILGHLAITLSNLTVLLHKGQLNIFLDKGFASNKFFMVSQPLEFPDFEKLDAQSKLSVKRHLGFQPTAQVVGVVGRMDQDKNIQLLKDVCLSVWEKKSEVAVLLIGSGGKKKDLEVYFENQNCVFLEQVPRDSLSQYYQICDCILQTSFSEGLSSVIGESLFFGVPVIASDSGPVTKALVSNICYSRDEFVQMILNKSYKLDSFPEELEIEYVKSAWQELIEQAAS